MIFAVNLQDRYLDYFDNFNTFDLFCFVSCDDDNDNFDLFLHDFTGV